MTGYFGLALLTAVTVGKVMLCALLGMFVSLYFHSPKETEKGFSHISTRVFLPCLLFSNLCLGVSWESLGRFYWAPVLSCLPFLIGFLCHMLFRYCLSTNYHGMLFLACLFQNGLTFPLSILLALRGIPWMDADALALAQNYIFLYCITCSLGLWCIGEPVVAYYKAMEDRSLQHLKAQEVVLVDIRPSDEGVSNHPNGEVAMGNNWTDAVPCKGSNESPASPHLHSTQAPVADSAVGADDQFASTPMQMKDFCNILYKTLHSPPVFVTLLALVVSLTPPLRWAAESFIGKALMGGFQLIGNGAVPLQLLVLGCTVMGQQRTPSEDTVSGREVGTPVDPSNTTGVSRFLSRYLSPQTTLLVICIFTRLVAVPAIFFLVLHLIRGVLPNEKAFLFTMLIASASPSAINSSLICTMHDYHPRVYAKLMFIMYVASILSTTIWLFLYILYLGGYE